MKLGAADLQAIRQVKKLTPGETQANELCKRGLAKKLYRPLGSQDEKAWNAHKPEGPYEYAARFKPNDKGKPTKAADAVQDLLMPSLRADAARIGNRAPAETVRLKDKDGQTHYLDPARAEGEARRLGWSPAVTVSRAASVVGGIEGDMLWRRARDQWEPTGRATCGMNGRPAHQRMLQVDPDGKPWRFVAEEWRCLSR